jgi:hypothetical protein
MTELERKKKKLELSRVQLAREEMEVKIEERLAEIERLKEFIAVQEAKEKEIKGELSNG